MKCQQHAREDKATGMPYYAHSLADYENECLICYSDGRGEEEVGNGDMEEGDGGDDRYSGYECHVGQ